MRLRIGLKHSPPTWNRERNAAAAPPNIGRMNPLLGWALAILVVITGWQSYGWQGVFFALTIVVFWLLLQFNRSIRVMKNAAGAPKGHIDSAVMFNTKLKAGLPLMNVLTLTKSLGVKIADAPETYRWTDEGDSSVTLVFDGGRLRSWTLDRPQTVDEPANEPAGPAP